MFGAYYYAIRQHTHYLEGVKNRGVINGRAFDANQGSMGYDSAAITIKGGTFRNSAKNVFQNDNGIRVLLAEGYDVVENDDVSWTVKPYVAKVGEGNYTSVKDVIDALGSEGGSVELLENIDESATLPDNVTIIAGGFIISSIVDGGGNCFCRRRFIVCPSCTLCRFYAKRSSP